MNLEVKEEILNSNREYSKDEILIRNYKSTDYEATLEILTQLHNLYDIGLKRTQWRPASGLRLFKPNLKRITLVAELKSTKEVIGMGMIEASKNNLGQYVGYLENWAIKKEFIGKKIGKILADRAVKILRSWGCELIRINLSYTASEKLLNVFKRSGFSPIITVLEKRY
ncbi:MAG: GNAT family N-acetyltransferase [Candidatus Thorarchaeota archaeon]